MKKKNKKFKKMQIFCGITLESGVRLGGALSEFYKPLPKVIAWYSRRILRKHKGNPQVGHILLISMLNKQDLFAALQAISFFGGNSRLYFCSKNLTSLCIGQFLNCSFMILLRKSIPKNRNLKTAA